MFMSYAWHITITYGGGGQQSGQKICPSGALADELNELGPLGHRS